MSTGKVYIVGAGPGEPGLISVKGLEYLRRADVVVYDRLLNEQLLDVIPPEAEKIYVGKSAEHHAMEQDGINQVLVEKAKAGKTVVRLKGGDPFVLGRGGEEGETLTGNDIPFEIVPGITSAVAVPAYAGIPVTHRGLASSFAVITGHEDPDKEISSIAWDKLATGVDTLVFLMGMKNLPQIVSQLTANGRAEETPVAVIKNGASARQKTVVGNLSDIVNKVKEQKITAPAVIVVGEVVKMREKLRWFDNRPLFNRRVLVTRARQQASTLSKLLAEKGAQPVELPAIEIQAMPDTGELDIAINNLKDYDWLIFTSVNGVEAFFNRLHALKRDSRALNGLSIGAIGPATAMSLESRGIMADYIPSVYTGAGVLTGLKEQSITGKRFLLARADIADKELAEGLSQLGAEVKDIAVYRTVAAPEAASRAGQMLAAGEIDIITFTSSSTVTNLMAALNQDSTAVDHARIACIGPKTAETARKAGLKIDIMAAEQTIPGLVSAIEQYFSKED